MLKVLESAGSARPMGMRSIWAIGAKFANTPELDRRARLKWLGALFAAALTLWQAPGFGATQAQIDDAWKYGLWWLIKSQNGDGYWDSQGEVKVIATALAVQALNRAPLKTVPFSKGVAWLSNAKAGSVDSLARQAIALNDVGLDITRYVDLLMSRRVLTDRGTWGAYDHFGTSFPDTPLGLAASRLPTYRLTIPQWGQSICELILSQSTSPSSGTWGYFGRTRTLGTLASYGTPAILPTASNLLEIKVFQGVTGNSITCGTTGYTLDTILTNGIAWLAARQNGDGGFGVASTSTVFETAHVYKAMTTIDAGNAAKLVADAYLVAQVSTSQGGWGAGGSRDSLVTALVLSVLPLPSAAVIQDTDGDGIPNVVEVLMGKNASVADAGFSQGGNTEPGLRNSYSFPAPLLRNLALSFNPAISGGKAPYAWRVSAGALPVGMALLGTTGTLAGKPTAAGPYSVAVTVTDAAGASVSAAYDVVVSDIDGVAILGVINSLLLDDN